MAFGPIAHFIYYIGPLFIIIIHYTDKYHKTFHSSIQTRKLIFDGRLSSCIDTFLVSSLSLVTILTIFVKSRTDPRKYGSICITPVQL